MDGELYLCGMEKISLINFLLASFCILNAFRQTLANFLAQNRPKEGQKFELFDGIIDVLLVVLNLSLAHFFIFGL